MNRTTLSLDVQQICVWLGLPPGSWPPDHYTLLGLPPGEPDIERIEQHIHERLMRLRCYQLSNPGLATEAMTRLAQAFDCLTSDDSKKAYDSAHFPHLKPAAPRLPPSRVPTTLASDTAETPALPPAQPAPPAPAQWQSAAAPPPVRASAGNGESAPSMVSTTDSGVGPALVSLNIPAPIPSSKSRCLFLSSSAIQELGTRRDLFERVLWTRRLSRAWARLGRFISKPQRRLTKLGDDAELTRLLTIVEKLIQEGPGVLGQPGQPGYRVLALSRQGPPAERFRSLDPDQREALAKDYSAGCILLEEYREVLMEEVKSHRQLPSWKRHCRAADAVLTANKMWVLLGLGLLAILILAAVLIIST